MIIESSKSRLNKEKLENSSTCIDNKVINNKSECSLFNFSTPYQLNNHMIITNIENNKPVKKRVMRKHKKPQKMSSFFTNSIPVVYEGQGKFKGKACQSNPPLIQVNRNREINKEIKKTIEQQWFKSKEQQEVEEEEPEKLKEDEDPANNDISQLNEIVSDLVRKPRRSQNRFRGYRNQNSHKKARVEENKESEDELADNNDFEENNDILHIEKATKRTRILNQNKVKKVIQCPVCTQYIDSSDANSHVNECLTTQEFEEVYLNKINRKRKQSSRAERCERRENKRIKNSEEESTSKNEISESQHKSLKLKESLDSNSSTQSVKSK